MTIYKILHTIHYATFTNVGRIHDSTDTVINRLKNSLQYGLYVLELDDIFKAS